MNQKFMKKILPLVLIALLIQINFYGLNFGSSSDLPRDNSIQPYNSFRNYIWGGLGEQKDDKYGWNLTYIENLNGDAYPDLVIGTPWYSSGSVTNVGRVYIFYGAANTGFNDINCSKADVTITGDGLGHKFGWSVGDAGDMNNDGINDLIVGAPGVLNNRGRAYIFYGGGIPSGSSTALSVADRILNGITPEGYYGSAVAGVGDLNCDGYGEVAVGAPGVDHVVITYGYKNKVTLYPNLWDDNKTSKGIVTFDNGCNNGMSDGNTWGLGMGDDGWDWIDSFNDPTRLYGHTSSAAIDHATHYAPWEPGGPDADGLTFSNRSALEVTIGRNHTDYNPYGLDDDWVDDPEASAAWGIQFNITPEQWGYISGNSTISLEFDYSVVNTNWIYKRTNTTRYHTYAIRSRFWNSTTTEYMGDVLVSNQKYIYYYHEGYNTPCWSPVLGSYQTDVTNYIDGVGTYYWDFGCYLNFYSRSHADDGMMVFFDNITMKISNERSVIIEGSKKSGFGTSIVSAGDIDNDGYPDTLIGAPYLDGGYAGLLPGKKKYKEIDSISLAKIILTGKNQGDRFGYSISSAGDVDNDGKTDIIIGAPGGNYANLYYGSTLNTPLFVPDLWEKDQEKGTPQIEFDTGVKTTGNTPGLSAADDGWDTWNGVHGSGGTAGSAVTYNGVDGISSQAIDDDNELIIYIGGTLGGGGWGGAKPDSGAYGVKFSVSQEMVTAMESGCDAVLSYDWRFRSIGLDQDDTIWIKTFLRSDSENLALGWELDKNAVDNNNKDDTNEVYWADIPEDTSSVFVQECSECFSTPGSYYLDIGAKLRNWYYESGGVYEDGVFHFDNLYLRINPPPDVKFIGPAYSGFGHSVTYSNKLNIDDYVDIVIGAPYYDSPNGNDSGAIFGYVMGPNSNKIRFIKDSEFITYGEKPDDNFGWALLGALNLDSDDFNEVITSAINYDSPTQNIGRIYIYSISKGPRIRLLYPVGGEIINGEVKVNAIVVDPDDNIDNIYGVRFYYSTNLIDWTQFGKDTSESPNNIYEDNWNTTELPDGSNYYVKAWVRDLLLNNGENISSAITVDNPHPPKISIIAPELGEIVKGKLNIKVKAIDSELDNIGGGINTSRGIEYYLSKDQINWEYLGNQTSGTQDVYNITSDTSKYTDGNYWIKVNATDLDGFEVEETINFTLDNPPRIPNITLLSPQGGSELYGNIPVRAAAFDFDGDINSSGVTFYIKTETTMDDWEYIGNDSNPVIDNNGTYIYSIDWDTTTVPDNWYHLKAFVNDTEGLTNQSVISELKVHNSMTNPPTIKLISPISGIKLLESQIITAWVLDMEENIDEHGVDYYFSADKIQWRFIGTTANPRATEKEYYDLLWKTNTVVDGEYWLNVSVSDTTNLKSWDVSEEPVLIHNSAMNPPILKILSPNQGQHINGTFPILASAKDMENNIDTVGVVFSYSRDGKDWAIINNVATPKETGSNLYELYWDTTKHPDGKYWLRAEATDYDGLEGEVKSGYFFIHNKLENPPIVTFLGPNSGEVSGVVELNASAFDLENNLNEEGVKFLYSIDNVTWQPIRNDPVGTPMEEETLYYEISWDTSLVSDDIYWLRAEALDLTNLIGVDISDDQIIVHNKLDNPPRIIFKQPKKDVPLSQIESIIVEVIDFENDVASVSFYYTRDNKTWELIDTRFKPEIGNLYKTIWNTEELYNGKYFIKVIAKDQVGNQEELTEGPFEVKEGKEESVKTEGEFPYWVVIVIVVIIIMSLIIFMILRRSKRREKELIAEVAVEMREAGKKDEEKMPQVESYQALEKGTATPEAIQTYLPPPSEAPIPELPEYEADVETIESYKAQMESWKAEGYNITRLEQQLASDEQMFARIFPVFSSNITRLKNISTKLDSMDTTDHEAEVDSIKAKLFEPDQAMATEQEFKNLEQKLGLVPAELAGTTPAAGEIPELGVPPTDAGTTPELPAIDDMLPQLMPAAETPGAPPPDTAAPPDVELPPDIGLPPETGKAPTPEQEPKAEGEKKEEEK